MLNWRRTSVRGRGSELIANPSSCSCRSNSGLEINLKMFWWLIQFISSKHDELACSIMCSTSSPAYAASFAPRVSVARDWYAHRDPAAVRWPKADLSKRQLRTGVLPAYRWAIFFPILCFSCWAYLSLLYGSLARQIKFTQLDSNINPSRIWTCSGLHNMIFFIVASMFFIKLWSHINSTTKRVIPFSHSFTFFPRSLTTTLPPPATRPFALCLSTPWAQAPRNASSLSFVDRRPSSDMLVVAWLEGLGCRN